MVSYRRQQAIYIVQIDSFPTERDTTNKMAAFVKVLRTSAWKGVPPKRFSDVLLFGDSCYRGGAL